MPKHAGLTVQTRTRLFVAIAALAAILPLVSMSSSKEATIWTETSNGSLTTLSYGPLDPAKGPLFVLSCFSDISIVVLDVHEEIPGTKPGDPLTIDLSSARAQSLVKGEVGKNETTGTTFGEAGDVKVKPVLEVLRDSGPLTIKMGEASATLSDQGRADSVAKFVENCKLD